MLYWCLQSTKKLVETIISELNRSMFEEEPTEGQLGVSD